MKTAIPDDFLANMTKIHEPENLFSGLRLPVDFCLPDNILVFYHTWAEQFPNSHGRCTIVIPLDDMVYYVEREKIILHPGDVLFIPPHAQRFLHPDSNGYRRFFITFELRSVACYEMFFGHNALTEKSWEKLNDLLEAMFAGDATAASLCVLDFLKSWEKKEDGMKQKVVINAKLEDALEYIQTHLDYIDGLWDIARHCKLSESHLRNLFKREFGVSLGKYVAMQRLAAAKYMLRNTQLTIGEIAAKTGFVNQFIFSSFFKRNTRMPPSQFREKK